MSYLYQEAIKVLAEDLIKQEVVRYLNQCSQELTNQIKKTKIKKTKESLKLAAKQISMLADNIIPRR